MKFFIILVCLLLVYIGLRLAMPRLGKPVAGGMMTQAGETVLADCPDSPNCQCSESSRPKQKVNRLDVTHEPEQAIARLATLVGEQKGTQIVTQNDRYLHATFSTQLMRYTDDVEFLLSDDQQTVQVRSASRLGKSDLGANARRIEHLRDVASSRL